MTLCEEAPQSPQYQAASELDKAIQQYKLEELQEQRRQLRDTKYLNQAEQNEMLMVSHILLYWMVKKSVSFHSTILLYQSQLTMDGVLKVCMDLFHEPFQRHNFAAF